MSTTTWHNTPKNKSDRGRLANSPTEIPGKGWKDTLMRVKTEVGEDKLSLISAAMAYYCLFAFVPAITSFVLLYTWISDPAEISNHIAKISTVIPGDMFEMMKTQLTSLAAKPGSSLGLGAIFTLLLSLWSASKGSKCLMEALNIIYDEKDERGFIKANLLALGLTFLGALMGILAIGVIVGFPAVTHYLHLGKTVESVTGILSWVVLLGLFSLYLSLAYRFGPHRDNAKWRWVSPGAIIAAVLWAITSAGFSIYATEFGNFNKTYGSLGAVIILMTWFYLSSFVILLGAEFNAELEHQTKKDTTQGPPKPMGERNATMADTLGKSTPP